MSTPNNNGNCTSHNQDKKPATLTNPHLALSPTKSPNQDHTTTTTGPESQQSDTPVLLRQQHALPSFDIAHHGWDASNVSTAKCDLCHRQRRGTLQKCRVCKLSICRECCVGGRLQNDRRHAIDAAAVDWDAPPNLRKRKRQAMGSGEEISLGPKRQKASVRRGRGRGRAYGGAVVDEARGMSASSVVVSDQAVAALNGEVPWQSAARFREYGHADPMEPRLSVAPASYYPSVGRAQRTEIISPKYTTRYEPEMTSSSNKILPVIEEVCDGGGNDEEYRASLHGEGYHAASAPGLSSRRPISPANSFSQAAPSQPILPPVTPLLGDGHVQHHHSTETFQTSSDIRNRLDHFLHHHHQPFTSESWPLHEHTDSLGTSLANAARASHASNAPKPLDHCLRDELQAVWTSRAFIAQDPDAGRRYRRLLAAAYFASTCLGLEPRGNAAREWLCGEERKMREMGYEPTKSAQLLDFLQEVGVWYLRQAQR